MKTDELWRCSRRGCNWVGREKDKRARTDQEESARWGLVVQSTHCPMCDCRSFFQVGNKWVKLIGLWHYRIVTQGCLPGDRVVELRHGKHNFGFFTVAQFTDWVHDTANRLLVTIPDISNATISPPQTDDK